MKEDDLPATVHLGRQLNDMALAAGRKRQSPQTGYIHYFYASSEEEAQQTIPIVENACFVLALFRTKTSEQMAEAKEMLERLLFFQHADGNFPIYIHEYPNCKDRFLGVQLLPVFYYILQEFHAVLGAELKKRLQHSVSKLIHYALQAYDEKNPPYPIGMKIAAAAKVLGVYFKESLIEQRGDQLLDQYFNMGLHASWFVPASLADICIALQMTYANLQQSPWTDFVQHLMQTWHQTTRTYIGPALKQYQQADEPQTTLYDLLLGYLTQGFSTRALKNAPYHLLAVLIRPTEEFLLSVQQPFYKEGWLHASRWVIYQQDNFAYSIIDKSAMQNPAQENAFHPLSLVWGSQEKVHTFVLQGGNFDAFEFEPKGNEIELHFKLSPAYELEDREKCRELSFFFDIEPNASLAVHGEAATTFDLGEEFLLSTSQLQLSLNVFLEKGEGQFLGHLMKGNRPSQIQLKGSHRYKAYDWQLFFRTLRRSNPCQFKASLRIDPC